MRVLVLNAGSSSLKYKLFDSTNYEVLQEGLVENIGENNPLCRNHHDALESLDIEFSSLDAVGHRVVHGGEEFSQSVLINDAVMKSISSLIPLAPLHNPANLEGIRLLQSKLGNIPQVAVFDTAFHSTMPKEAYLYALPFEMYEKYKIRRYGFHGTSHSYVVKKCAERLNKNVSTLNLITLHLGNGASVCAIENGKSIDTSMGFTPLEGLVMGSRSGDIDPAIVLYMQRELGLSVDALDTMLNKKSGLLGICGENDVRKILESKSEKSQLALDMMVRRIQKYIGSYIALLGDVDVLVFTGGIGENSSYIREKILKSKLFENIRVEVIPTDEELEIMNEVISVVRS